MMRPFVTVVALLGCVACGGKAAPAAVTASEAPAQTVSEPAPDLSQVAAPKDLVLVARVARPKTLLETLAVWSGLPIRFSDMLPPSARELEHVIAWDAPLEIVAVLDPQAPSKRPAPLLVGSVGLVSLEGSLDALQSLGAVLTRIAPGVHRLSVDGTVYCAVAPSLGSTPARLVCADEWRSVEELLPYAARGLPERNLGTHEIHVELNPEPIRRRYLREISATRAMAGLLLRMASTDNRRLDQVLSDVAYAIADELKALAMELHSVELTGRLDGAGKALELQSSLVIQHRGAAERSFFSQMLEETANRAVLPDDSFWELPATAHSAAYGVPLDLARQDLIVKRLAELLDAYLEHEKVTPRLRKRVRRVFEAYPALASGGVQASGSVENPDAQPLLFRGTGWSVGTANVRADVLTTAFSELASLVQDRELSRLLRERFDWDPKQLPKVKTQIVRVKGFDPRATAYTVELPAGLVERLNALDRTSRTSAETPTKSASFATIVVPDGQRSYIAHAPDQRQALALLEGIRNAPAEARLSARADLAPLRNTRALWAGYWSLEAMVSLLGRALPRGPELLSRMPNRGRSPWLMQSQAVGTQGGATLSYNARLPQAAFQDLGSLLPELLASGALSAR